MMRSFLLLLSALSLLLLAQCAQTLPSGELVILETNQEKKSEPIPHESEPTAEASEITNERPSDLDTEPPPSPEETAPEESPQVEKNAEMPTTPDASEETPPDLPPQEATPEAAQRRLRIAVISDLNNSYGSTSYSTPVHDAIRAIRDIHKPDLVLCTGDMVAGQRAGLDYKAMWAAFHRTVTLPLQQAQIPFAVTPGNHDASAYSGFVQERQEYIAQWQQHKPALTYLDDTHYPLYYAFSMGPALFISIDATTVGKLPAAQQRWLEDILTRHAPQYPIRIVFSHLSLYPFAVGRETEIIGDPLLEQLFNQHGVTAHISGHQHAYYPGKRTNLRLISMACLGAGPRALIGNTQLSSRSLLLLDIEQGQLRSVEAYGGNQMDQIISRQTLPPAIQPQTAHEIKRDDLP